MKDSEKKQLVDLAEKKAVEAQLRDDTCARSTLHGLSCVFPFISEKMVSASWALTGGVAASSGSCGALCSGLLAVGAKYMPSVAEAEEGSEEARKKFEYGRDKLFEYRDAFLKEFGALTCPGVQQKIFGRSYNLLDEKELMEFLSMEGHEVECAAVVAKAARMAAELILEDD
ncbi:MAG: C-GCAxxG-C-C family protein [Bacillota bacterium]|nr:C-GCAxxG-C-C family protein [Bacillota bacterium]